MYVCMCVCVCASVRACAQVRLWVIYSESLSWLLPLLLSLRPRRWQDVTDSFEHINAEVKKRLDLLQELRIATHRRATTIEVGLGCVISSFPAVCSFIGIAEWL